MTMWPLKIRLGMFLGLLAFVALLRQFLVLTEPFTYGNNIWRKELIRISLKTLHDWHAKEENLVLFMGASEAEIDFDPVAYDALNSARKLPTISFNLGLGDVTPIMPLYIGRIASELEHSGARPKIIFLCLSVSGMTKKSKRGVHYWGRLIDAYSVYFSADAWDRCRLPLGTKLTLATDKYVFAEHSLLQIPLFFSGLLQAAIPEFRSPLWRQKTIWKRNTDLKRYPAMRGQFYGDVHEYAPLLDAARAALKDEAYRRL